MTSEAFLTAFDEAMSETPKGTGEKKTYEGVPDGDYTVTMKPAELSHKEGRDTAIVLKYYFPTTNKEEWEFLNINERAAKVIAGKCKALGLSPRSGDEGELLRTFQQTNGWTIKVRKATTTTRKGDNVYQNKNYYINGVVSRGETTSAPQPKLDADSIPF